MHCTIEARWEFDIEDGSENSHRDGRIMELEVQLKDHKNKYISKTPSYLVVNFSTFQYLAILFDLVT